MKRKPHNTLERKRRRRAATQRLWRLRNPEKHALQQRRAYRRKRDREELAELERLEKQQRERQAELQRRQQQARRVPTQAETQAAIDRIKKDFGSDPELLRIVLHGSGYKDDLPAIQAEAAQFKADPEKERETDLEHLTQQRLRLEGLRAEARERNAAQRTRQAVAARSRF